MPGRRPQPAASPADAHGGTAPGEPRIAVAVLVRPEADPSAALAALEAAGMPGARTVALPSPGAWAAARNAALEQAGEADVLALVDDDVHVEPGWGEALRETWTGDGAEALGAALGPVAGAGAPEWLPEPEEHAEVLGLWNGAGNASFRVTALRGVGGFFPARGHRDARDTFGDDWRAASELHETGWRVQVVDRLEANRDLSELTPGALLRRRLRTGARARVLAPRRMDRRTAAVVGLRSSAVAAVRVVRGDTAGALDRAAWAAHGAGAMLGPLLAEAGLEPDRRSTPLRPSVPDKRDRWPYSRGWRPRRRAAIHGAILLYHRVAERAAGGGRGLVVAPARFAEHLDVLRARFTPAPLEAVLAGEAGPDGVAITFDDGYHDNLLNALPALRDAGATATLFASTGHIATGEGFWWDEVARLIRGAAPAAGRLELVLPEGVRAWAPRDAAERAAAAGHVHAALQMRDRATIAAALLAIRRWAGVRGGPGAPPAEDRPLTVAELRALAAAGPFVVQAHGRTHVSLAHADPAVRAAELHGSADDLEAWLGRRPTIFAYPFGVAGVDVDPATRAAARGAGYRWAATTSPGLVRAHGTPLGLRRLAVPDVDGEAFERWLSAALPVR